MARCAYCQTETELYAGGSPLCIQCADLSPDRRATRAKLVHDLHEATMRAEAATEAFSAIADDIPSALPHPDGIQRIHNASREMEAARKEMITAHTRLNDFIEGGIVPEDLKQRR
jgi:hypothetical protein